MAVVYKQKHVEDGIPAFRVNRFHAVAGIPAFRVQRVKDYFQQIFNYL